MDEQTKRQKIKEIRDNPNLTSVEKSKQIQLLMSGNYSFENKEVSNFSKTCKHRSETKKCYKLYFSCCNLYDPCTNCHFDRPIHIERVAKLKVKPLNTLITCMKCETEQVPSNNCVNSECGITFAKNYCSICPFWTDGKLYHCDKCNVCLPFNKEEIKHCDECNLCIIVNGKRHDCKKRYREMKCICCSESVVLTPKTFTILNCSHPIHTDCLNDMKIKKNYRCPICKKSMWNMSAEWELLRTNIKFTPLPIDIIPIMTHDIVKSPYGRFKVLEYISSGNNAFWRGEFVDWKLANGKFATGTINEKQLEKQNDRHIICNDCGVKSYTMFHFYGLECKSCGSFNTQV